MKSTWRIVSGLLALVLVGMGFVWAVPGGVPPTGTAGRAAGGGFVLDDDPNVLTAAEMQVYVSEPVTPVLTVAARDLPAYRPGPPEFDREMARKDDFGFVGPDIQMPPHGNPLVDLQRGAPAPAPDSFGTPVINVVGVQSGSSPPDDTGEVGPSHYLQADNGPSGSRITVYDKSGVQLGQFHMESLAPDSPCNSGYCDPTVVYDHLADRWFINEFSSDSSNPYCLYVSQTPDPLGAWYYYTWDLPYFDYPKYGLWPDAYYMAYNGGTTGQRQVFAFDRAKMLAGQAATYQMFSTESLPNLGFQLLMPASLEGPTAPPAGAPGIFMRPRDTEVSGGTCAGCDLMEMWEFHIDWTTPANSTLTRLPDVPMVDYDCTLCGTGSIWACMPQPDTTQKIDPIREPIHYQLQYRNWGAYETLVGCFVEDVDGTDHAAVRWFEMRKAGGVWSMHQQGTLGGEANVHRSVCSAAMDSEGNIAVGYTRTGDYAPYYPSVYYSGRMAADPLGTMPYYDNVIWDATTSKTNNERWGDYSGIGVDPADDCTFWYTTEYGGSGQTRVAAFKFDCCPRLTVDSLGDSLDVCIPKDAVFNVAVGDSLSCLDNVPVTMSVDGQLGEMTVSWGANPVAPPATAVLTIGDTETASPGSYTITIAGISGPYVDDDEVVLNLVGAAPGVTALAEPAKASIDVVPTPTFVWSDVGGGNGTTSYDLQVATDPTFALPLVISESGLLGTSYTPDTPLAKETAYYWRVRAVNACGRSDYTEAWAFRTGGVICRSYAGAVGQIKSSQVNLFNLTVPSGDNGTIVDVDVVDLRGTHSYISDLEFTLDSPAAMRVALIPQMCGNDVDFDKDLDDEAVDALACPLSDGTRQRPLNPLAKLDREDSAGTWVLRITDNYQKDNGRLLAWNLYICTLQDLPLADYSDLAASYGVAWHTGGSTLQLGPTWSADTDFLGPDDSDDGVTFPNGWVPGQSNIVRVNVQGTPAEGRWLRLWFDWDENGVFDDSELVHNGPVSADDNDFDVSVPPLSQPVNYRARLYDSSGAPAALDPLSYGGAAGGEVEDNMSPAPTAVRLTSFAARPAVGGVLVVWETTSEEGNAGFNLYRSDSPTGLGQMLNEGLIPSEFPGGGQGAAYEFLDTAVLPGGVYYYTLETVDMSDGRAFYGPTATGLWRAYLPVVGRARP